MVLNTIFNNISVISWRSYCYDGHQYIRYIYTVSPKGLVLWCLMSLSTIFQLYRGGLLYIYIYIVYIYCLNSITITFAKHYGKSYTQTETCKKYSVTLIFFCIFHMKPQFFKTLFQSLFLFDFDDIFTNRSENVCSFL
jgi:hypothetical protein